MPPCFDRWCCLNNFMRNFLTPSEEKFGIWPALYCLWATMAIALAISIGGLSSENVTRLLVLAFLFVQITCRSMLVKSLLWLTPKARFIVLGTVLAAVVEGFHLTSMPVFLSLRIGWDTPLTQGLLYYALDLLFTVPAYVAIFAVIWHFINRYHYPLWQYVVVVGLAQTLGDGGLFFFFNAPAMLFFLPYPMTNYHAINVIPFLAVREHLSCKRSPLPVTLLAIPGLILTYLVCGALIKLLGRFFGLESN